jgi:hypothetical protein
MTVTAYWQTQQSNTTVSLQNNNATVVIKLRLPNTGKFVVWGKVGVFNLATTPQDAAVSITTDDGATLLDFTSVGIGASNGSNIASVSLQGVLDLSASDENEIVDIRCGTTNGQAAWASPIAIPVDAFSGSL